MKNKISVLFVCLLFVSISTYAKPKNYLAECLRKMGGLSQREYLTFSYTETVNKLEHSFEPWQQTNYFGKGIVWSNGDRFLKHDTLSTGNRVYTSKTSLSPGELLFIDYGDKDLFPVTEAMYYNLIIQSARYSPTLVLKHFIRNKAIADNSSTKEQSIWRMTINNAIVTLSINTADYLLTKVTILEDDDLFGDVLSTYTYSGYKNIDSIYYGSLVEIERINGKIKEQVKITNTSITSEAPLLLNKPTDYSFKAEEVFVPEVKLEKYSEHIHFLELKHTDDKVMIVEFANFLLVAEAPMNSKNGDLIIDQAKKIAPNKPIKYFVFGHYHPHYIGGMRSFVHEGAEIIASKEDEDYVRYLANAKHTINPDNLQRNPRQLAMKEIKDSLTVTDGEFPMKIYFIGKKSEHTNDYLIYYFPKEKLLFQDDLVWIARDGEIKKAGRRQAGLYKAVKELKLDVQTIIQSWPVKDYGVKTVIPFSDLEKSMTVN